MILTVTQVISKTIIYIYYIQEVQLSSIGPGTGLQKCTCICDEMCLPTLPVACVCLPVACVYICDEIWAYPKVTWEGQFLLN